MNKRLISLVCALALALVSCCAFAEGNDTVSIILGTGTAQAFADAPVAREDIETILQAGLAAASAINQQPWYFVAITDADLMKEVSGSGSGAAAGGAPAGFSGAPAGGGEGAPADFGGSSGAPAGAPEGAPGGDFGGSSGAPAGGAPGGAGGSAKAGFGDSPAAIIIYKAGSTSSPNPDFDCGLAAQNMVIAASALGYGVKIVSSPTMTLNGANHDAICEKLGVDKSMQAVAVLLIGVPDTDAVSSASTRDTLETKTSIFD